MKMFLLFLQDLQEQLAQVQESPQLHFPAEGQKTRSASKLQKRNRNQNQTQILTLGAVAGIHV